jgi:hypothetical protein
MWIDNEGGSDVRRHGCGKDSSFQYTSLYKDFDEGSDDDVIIMMEFRVIFMYCSGFMVVSEIRMPRGWEYDSRVKTCH